MNIESIEIEYHDRTVLVSYYKSESEGGNGYGDVVMEINTDDLSEIIQHNLKWLLEKDVFDTDNDRAQVAALLQREVENEREETG